MRYAIGKKKHFAGIVDEVGTARVCATRGDAGSSWQAESRNPCTQDLCMAMRNAAEPLVYATDRMGNRMAVDDRMPQERKAVLIVREGGPRNVDDSCKIYLAHDIILYGRPRGARCKLRSFYGFGGMWEKQYVYGDLYNALLWSRCPGRSLEWDQLAMSLSQLLIYFSIQLPSSQLYPVMQSWFSGHCW